MLSEYTKFWYVKCKTEHLILTMLTETYRDSTICTTASGSRGKMIMSAVTENINFSWHKN